MIIQIPLITVIIPTLGKAGVGLTARCLKSMFEAHEFVKPQVIVVDDGSGEEVVTELADMLMAYEGAELVACHQNGGFAKACNQGIRRANGRSIFLVNNDVYFDKCPTLQIMADSMIALNAGVVGTRLLYPDNTIQHAGVVFVPTQGQPFPGFFDHLLRGQPAQHLDAVTIRPILVTGALFGISSYAPQVIGLLDERYGMTCEDTDYGMEVISAGMGCYYNGYAWAYHEEGKTRGRTPEDKTAINPAAWEAEKKALELFFRKWIGVDWSTFMVHQEAG